jgi:hypothetical protein
MCRRRYAEENSDRTRSYAIGYCLSNAAGAKFSGVWAVDRKDQNHGKDVV